MSGAPVVIEREFVAVNLSISKEDPRRGWLRDQFKGFPLVVDDVFGTSFCPRPPYLVSKVRLTALQK